MTAVEWFIKEIEKHDKEFSSFYGAEITQAKEMEQQQREDAFKEGGEAVSDYLNKEACRQLGILPYTKIK
jgi:hypothetical protein